MKKIKLLYYDFYMPYLVKDGNYPVGGATVEWYSWIKGLEANNYEVGVLTWKGANKFAGNNHSINFIETYDPKAGLKKIRWLFRYRTLYKSVKNFNPDYLLQECAGFETGIIAYIAKKLNIPFIYRVANDIDTDNRINKRLNYRQKLFFRYGLRNSSAIFCQNSYQFEQINDKFPNIPKCIIHNPISFNGELPEVKIYSKRSYIAWIGIFQYQKNLPALYEIVKKMPNIKFKIAGTESNSMLKDKNTQIALKGLRECNNAEFVGYLKRNEILPFLSRAYMLLNTSHYEGFSNTYLEALAAGTPIVASNNADPDNIIPKNNLGLIVKDNCEYDDAINTIIKNKHYDLLAKRCRNYLLNNHDTISLSRKFIKYLKLVK